MIIANAWRNKKKNQQEAEKQIETALRGLGELHDCAEDLKISDDDLDKALDTLVQL